MTTPALQKIGKKTAIVSFVGGTSLFLLYFITANDNLLFGGLAYIAIVGIFNFAILTLIVIRAFKDQQQKGRLFRTAGLMLLNIPMVFFLFWLVGLLLNTMRVTIVNSTGQDITDVIIEGCERKHVMKIESGGSQTFWIKIPGDCAVFMKYKQGNSQRTEQVVGYLSSSMGGKTMHRVGTNDVSGI
jgi:hypothetical protein